jgi:hypothetical protein
VSMMVWMVGAALAEGTGVWLSGTPDPTQDLSLEHIPVSTVLLTEGWSAADDRAIAHLSEELAAVAPLLDVFDGELQIMRRLDDALASITALREQDRELVFRALLFQGLAVQRYFQDALGDEAGAAPYRVQIAGSVVNRPWIDAVALDPDRKATSAEIPEEPERLLFQELRARHLLAPTAQIVATGLPDGARLIVDGEEATSDRVRVLPGTHRASLVAGGELSVRVRALVAEDETVTLTPVALRADIAPMASSLSSGERVVLLPMGMQQTLSGLESPVSLFVSDSRRVHRYVVEGPSAIRHEAATSSGTGDESGLHWRVLVGGGWVYDGDYLLLNAEAGAPSSVATVNAGAPLLSGGVELPLGPAVVGAGIDGLLPLGEWHALPSGEQTIRARLYPHVEAGVGPVRLTAGYLFPWHVGLGPRARVLVDPERGIELTAAYIYGVAVPSNYDSGEAFTPEPLQAAWVGVGLRR